MSALVLGIVLLTGTDPALSQSVRGAPSGEELLRAGETAFGKSEYASAAQYFAKALRSADLPEEQVANALYKRGVSNEKAGKPAQAIADITSALFLPGLPNKDRAEAYMSRGRAYQAVGMNDLAGADIERGKRGGASVERVARASPQPGSGAGGNASSFSTSSDASGPGFSTSSEPTRGAPAASGFQTLTQSRSGPSKPPARSSNRRIASFETSSRTSGNDDDIPRFRTTIEPDNSGSKPARQRTASTSSSRASPSWETSANVQAPASAAASVEEENGNTVSRFFGNVWAKATGGDDDKPAQSAPPPPASPASNRTASPAPSWSQTTATRAPASGWDVKVSPSSSPAPPPSRAAPAPLPAAAPGGNGYRIQLAALKSDAEAQATWKRLRSKHGALLGSHQPNIVRTELGGLGTFYRVQLGPFADKSSSQQLCERFKSGGLDCFLLAP